MFFRGSDLQGTSLMNEGRCVWYNYGTNGAKKDLDIHFPDLDPFFGKRNIEYLDFIA